MQLGKMFSNNMGEAIKYVSALPSDSSDVKVGKQDFLWNVFTSQELLEQVTINEVQR